MENKILLESHNIKNLFSGFGQFNYWLLRNLAKKNNRYEFTALAKNKKSITELGESFHFKKYYGFQRYSQLRIREKFNIWHSLNQNSKIEPYHEMPYLLTIHDVIFIEKEKPQDVDQKQFEHLKQKIERSDYLVFISQYAKDSTNKYFKIPPSIPQKVIYNGNPVQRKDAISNIPENAINPSKPFLFCIGQFLEMKNFHSLIPFLAKLKDYDLVIAGNNDKPYRSVVEKEIEKHGLQDRVKLPGKISETEKHYYLQHCAAFVFPSLHEGFGLPPIEAMAYGKPVFLANRTSLPEIGGEVAFYWENFEPDDMLKVFENGMDLYESDKVGFQARLEERAAFFDWEKTASQYLEVYAQILN
ncbi:MAG: glycosyltransferase family 1 protein [Salegentibacter sp.]